MSTTEVATVSGGARWQVLVLAVSGMLPGGLLILATAAMLCGLPFGADPLWEVDTITLSEAAALRDNGEVVRLIESGVDVNTPGAVRQDIVAARALVLTPLEAAVASRRADMVELLLEQGAQLDAATWTRLVCFSNSVKATDILSLIEPRRPVAATENCDRVDIPW
jgi:hypothetical protein